jgi:aminoglycoside 3-N-acetyltransferase I
MMHTLYIRRLGPVDHGAARALFTLMAEVFEEEHTPLSDAYLARLLNRDDFWALAAFDGDAVIGGLTAHVLPMTRTETSELFIYDLAVRADQQRRGVGRQLIAATREQAATAGIDTVMVPADVDDTEALAFYRAVGGDETAVAFFVFADD